MPSSHKRPSTAVAVPGRGLSSVGRALAWHARGQGFDSPRLHQNPLILLNKFGRRLHSPRIAPEITSLHRAFVGTNPTPPESECRTPPPGLTRALRGFVYTPRIQSAGFLHFLTARSNETMSSVRLPMRLAKSTSAAWLFGALSTNDRFEVRSYTRSIPISVRKADFSAVRICFPTDCILRFAVIG